MVNDVMNPHEFKMQKNIFIAAEVSKRSFLAETQHEGEWKGSSVH